MALSVVGLISNKFMSDETKESVNDLLEDLTLGEKYISDKDFKKYKMYMKWSTSTYLTDLVVEKFNLEKEVSEDEPLKTKLLMKVVNNLDPLAHLGLFVLTSYGIYKLSKMDYSNSVEKVQNVNLKEVGSQLVSQTHNHLKKLF